MGFHRLAIMGLSEEAMQPFERNGNAVVCNGEIYGFRALRRQLSAKYTFASDSDCECCCRFMKSTGSGMFAMLDAEFALILYDAKKDTFIAARDPIGIRPLYLYVWSGRAMLFCQRGQNLVGLGAKSPFPPGNYYDRAFCLLPGYIKVKKSLCERPRYGLPQDPRKTDRRH